MHFEIIFPGKTRERYILEGMNEYLKRISRYVKVEFRVVREHSGKGSEQIIRAGQAGEIVRTLPPSALVVGLDSRGRQVSSEELADMITGWENQGKDKIAVVIGGPFGFSEDFRNRADLLLSLSKMTFPHDMVRLIFLEQLYRAYSIKAGGRYHK